MNKQDEILSRLMSSPFRAKFHLDAKDKAYYLNKGEDVIKSHAEDFIDKRLAPAFIPNDGKQTPMRGHPVFKAQHACACCCRGCLEKWHKIPQGVELNSDQKAYVVSVIMKWIDKEMGND